MRDTYTEKLDRQIEVISGLIVARKENPENFETVIEGIKSFKTNDRQHSSLETLQGVKSGIIVAKLLYQETLRKTKQNDTTTG